MGQRLDEYIKHVISNVQFSALDHIGNNKGESVTAEGKEYTSLIEDGPHALGNIILHVLLPIGTGIVVAIFL